MHAPRTLPKMARPIVLVTLCAALLAACGNREPPQFGATAYRVEGLTTPRGGGPATHTIIYRDAAQMRVEATLPAIGSATIVFDDATGGAYVLNPTTQTNTAASAVGAPQPAPPTTPVDAVSGVALTPPAGVAVRIEDAEAPQPLETAWAALGADGLRAGARCTVAGERGREWRPREQTEGAERHACITDDGIVLMVTENGLALWEATSLARGPQDASLFGVPAGFRMVDPQTVASSEESEPPSPTPRG